jgi:hypothetical protein
MRYLDRYTSTFERSRVVFKCYREERTRDEATNKNKVRSHCSSYYTNDHLSPPALASTYS